MSFPTTTYSLQPTASPLLAGVDEAGRGPLAGPVYAAAVILDRERPVYGIRDSKKLSAEQREGLAVEIRQNALCWAVASAEVTEIDTLNILHATMLAMRRAIAGLGLAPRHIQVDGNRCPSLAGLNIECSIEAIVRGDDSVLAIGAASILAKVGRDAAMRTLHEQYPDYGFAIHKGYPTAMHLAALREHGACPEHRRTFGPVRAVVGRGQGTVSGQRTGDGR